MSEARGGTVTNENEVDLFPLMTVLFPGGPLPLRIFEPRYLDMVARCLRESRPFGVVLIAEGGETGSATLNEFGTTAMITDWYPGNDGLLGVTAQGQQRFRLLESRPRSDGLHVGAIEIVPEPEARALPERDRCLAEVLEELLDKSGSHYDSIPKNYGDAGWVSDRLAEVLPISLQMRQRCLELANPEERLQLLRPVLERLRVA